MDAQERIRAASKFLLQSPPGEINDVLNGMGPFSLPLPSLCPNADCLLSHISRKLIVIVLHVDVRNIISDDDSLQSGILPALREYNLEQFITANVPGHQHSVRVVTVSFSFPVSLSCLFECY